MIVNMETTRNGNPVSRSTLLGRAANRAMRELRRRYYSEYYKIYTDELDKLGIKRLPNNYKPSNLQEILNLTNEVNRLKELLVANGIEVIEFEEDR